MTCMQVIPDFLQVVLTGNFFILAVIKYTYEKLEE